MKEGYLKWSQGGSTRWTSLTERSRRTQFAKKLFIQERHETISLHNCCLTNGHVMASMLHTDVMKIKETANAGME